MLKLYEQRWSLYQNKREIKNYAYSKGQKWPRDHVYPSHCNKKLSSFALAPKARTILHYSHTCTRFVRNWEVLLWHQRPELFCIILIHVLVFSRKHKRESHVCRLPSTRFLTSIKSPGLASNQRLGHLAHDTNHCSCSLYSPTLQNKCIQIQRLSRYMCLHFCKDSCCSSLFLHKEVLTVVNNM